MKRPINKDLDKIFTGFISCLKQDRRCLGAWHFGSVSRDLQDEFSDVDIVLMIDEDSIESFDKDWPIYLEKICDTVYLKWGESFNSHYFRNYGLVVSLNDSLHQFDVFLMKKGYEDEFMCQIHRAGCQREDIILDKHGIIERLFNELVSPMNNERNIARIVDEYTFHCVMLKKYYHRKNFFKFQHILHTLYRLHAELLLAKYQRIDWGSLENLITNNLPQKHQKVLMGYFVSCDEDVMLQATIMRINTFIEDVKLFEESQINLLAIQACKLIRMELIELNNH